MIVINCSTADIPLQLPACAGSILKAFLFRPHGVKAELTATIDPTVPGIVRLTGIPATLPRGVYTLALHTPCGCFSTSAAVDCPAPALPATHHPTNAPGLIKVCCDPGPDPEPGPPGPPGPPGKDGQIRFTGHGPPGVIIGAEPDDTYMDLDTGDIYKLN